MATRSLRLSRDQLALFLEDHEQIKAFERLFAAADALANAPAPAPTPVPKVARYGQFLSTVTQTASAANTATPITFDVSDLSVGVFLRSPSTSEVAVDTAGTYEVRASLQLDKTAAGSARLWVWLTRNGADVASSAQEVQISGTDAETVVTYLRTVALAAGDYVEVRWAVSDTGLRLTSGVAASPVPLVPSASLSVANTIA
jgi:PKD repeat protein